jgi:hypothetical protein
MNRVKKTVTLLALCLGVCSAMASVAAATPTGGLFISGGQFQAETYPLDIGGQQTEAHLFSFGNLQVECGTVEMIGQLSGPSTSLSQLHPNIENCKTFISGKVVPDVNTCRFSFSISGEFRLTNCEAGGEFSIPGLRFDRYNKAGEVICHVNVRDSDWVFQPWTGVSYSNFGTGTTRGVQASINIQNLNYSLKGSGCAGMAPGAYKDGIYQGGLKFQALSNFWG